ncbi:hypothetical protein MAP00_004315 [Monascus purpureus]|nr:hypothetical protein MAP00_004315 [Monascus purpureus]
MDNSPKTIALVTCSIRNPRLNPFITDYVHQILTRYNSSSNNNNNNNNKTNSEKTISTILNGPPTFLEVLDIADQHLPLSTNEPAIPAHLPESDPTPHYVNEYSRVWSSKVRRYDAFIFITPQYNWSIPASLKNALDYLFHEWTGKPAGIVSYGGRGGGEGCGASEGDSVWVEDEACLDGPRVGYGGFNGGGMCERW